MVVNQDGNSLSLVNVGLLDVTDCLSLSELDNDHKMSLQITQI